MTWPHAWSGERRVPLRYFQAPDPASALPPRGKTKPRKELPPVVCTGRVRAIIAEVAAAHGLSVEEVHAGSRRHKFVVARHEAMHRLSAETRLSSAQIARALGLKDHSTVLHGLGAHARRTERPA